MAKTRLTQSEYLQLTGLLVLAARHNAALKDILSAAILLTGESDGDIGHTADAIYSDYSVEQLCQKLHIEVPQSVGAVDPVGEKVTG